MPISNVKQLCTPSAFVTSDSLVEQVAQIDDFAAGKIDGRKFFRRNYFGGISRRAWSCWSNEASSVSTARARMERSTSQAMGCGKTHSLIAFGLLASDPALPREVASKLTGADGFGAARVVIFNGHQNPETLLWGWPTSSASPMPRSSSAST